MSWQVSIEISDAVSASKYVRKVKNRIHYMEGLVEGLMVACQLESIIGALLVPLTMAWQKSRLSTFEARIGGSIVSSVGQSA